MRLANQIRQTRPARGRIALGKHLATGRMRHFS
jgi:hypothetical protein